MNIKHNLLEGDGVSFSQSPNHGGKFAGTLPDTIVIHYTAGSSAESSVRTLCDPKTKASAHVVVARDGAITQLVSFDTEAWHAGNSSYEGRTGFNKFSVGIEIDNAGRLTKTDQKYAAWFGKLYGEEDVIQAVHRNEFSSSCWHRYTEEQILAVQELCTCLIEVYEITMILGHEEISPGRKCDPGPAFPLEKLRERLLLRDRAEEGPAVPTPTQNAGLVIASKLNIRTSPGLGAPKAGPPLPRGTVVEILQEAHGWYEVAVEKRGWVKKDYIKT